MNQTKEVNYLVPFITMVVLMGLIGFLTVLNQQFQVPLKAAFLQNAGDMENTLATLLSFSFFMAYLVMGIPSSKSVEKRGYRGTLVLALIILIVGLGIFELSAWYFELNPGHEVSIGTNTTVPVAYFIFLVGSFVIGTAMTFLQVVVNPYLIACRVKGTSDVQRQNIAGTANSAMTTITPFFVMYVIFGGQEMDSIQIGSMYIPFALMIFVVAMLAFALTKINLPEIENTTSKQGEKLERSIWSIKHLVLGVLALFCYVGVEVSVGANMNLYAMDLGGSFAANATLMTSLYWGGLLVGRFCASFVSKVPANVQLTISTIISALLVSAAMVTQNPWLLVATGLFHSVMWGAIFSLAVKNLGRYTAAGSGALMLGIVGGAILPFLQGIVADIAGWQWTWIIVIIGELYMLYYALSGSKIRKKDNMTADI